MSRHECVECGAKTSPGASPSATEARKSTYDDGDES